MSPRIASMANGNDWTRLGAHVINRRVELGHKNRATFSEASGISTRILGDIETGRRSNFDPTTIAALEQTLGWTPGSAQRVVAGGEPTLKNNPQAPGPDLAPTLTDPTLNKVRDALKVVLEADITDDQLRNLFTYLLNERRRVERQRAEQVAELAQLIRGAD